MIRTKLCGWCKEIKPVNLFKKNKNGKNGINPYCRVCDGLRTTAHNRLFKIAFVKKLGGKCACCGETQIEFLTLDHINRDGAKHRKELGTYSPRVVWKDVQKQCYPRSKYQILCWNCNCATKYGKPCPHQKQKFKKYLDFLKSYESISGRK